MTVISNNASPAVYIVCGGRRSGTTLLTAILSSDEHANPLGQEAQILTRIVESYRWGRINFEQFGRSFFDTQTIYKAFFQETVARFNHEVAARISPGGVLVLKNPEFSLVLSDMATLFPDAYFLAAVRDPRDQIASELEVGMRRLSDNGRDIRLLHRDVAMLANNYMAFNREIIALSHQWPQRINIVRYEDLVLHPNKTLDHLSSITGLQLTFDPVKAWPRVSSLAALHSTASRSDLYDAPINSQSVGRFERDLTSKEIAVIETLCAEILQEFGYRQNS